MGLIPIPDPARIWLADRAFANSIRSSASADPGGPFHTGVDIFRILAEDDNIELFRLLHRGGHSRDIPARADTGVEIELLPERDIEAADSSAHGGSQGGL